MKNFKLQKGMTVAELLIAVAIFTVVMGAVTLFESNVFSYNTVINGSMATVNDAEVIIKTMAKEIRSASQGSDGSYPIERVSTSSMTFFSDTNSDTKKERIRYTLIGTNIYRASLIPSGSPLAYTGTESTTTIIRNVRNSTSTPVFEFFDGNYDGSGSALSQPVTPSAIRSVRINVSLDVNLNRSPVTRTYTAEATLRNLKDNL